MSILVYGMNHESAPIDVREKVAFPPADLDAAVTRLVRSGRAEEGVIVSTCNRTEIVAAARGDAAAEGLREFLAQERGVSREDLERHCYAHSGPPAVRHVFRVASSLDSMIVGEAQILGQVKEAYAAAARAGTLGPVLDGLLQRSFAVAKKVRSETGVARHPVSIAHAAAALARDIFGDLKDNVVMIVGAGKMAHLAARHLIGGGVREVLVANRSYRGAVELAGELGGRALPFDRLHEEMERVDIVIASTAAPHHVVRHEEALRLSRARRGRPLFLIDIAMPRDIDPRVNEIENVYLYDLDDLNKVVQAHRAERGQEAKLAEAIVDREVEAYLAWARARDLGPAIEDLSRHLHAVGEKEVARFRGRLAALTPEQHRTVEELAASLVNKVLHHPIQALKRAAALNGGGDRVALLRECFGLGAERGRTSGEADRPAGEAVKGRAAPSAPDGGKG
jgi:glutamyl-tRNA reductase